MSDMPYLQMGREISQKEFWLKAYLAAMCRVDHKSALEEADAALVICNERWNEKIHLPVRSCQHVHNYPIGAAPRESWE